MAPTETLIGSWGLESCVRLDPDGTTHYPFGTAPQGMLTYTDGGIMSVHLLAGIQDAGQTMDAYTGYYGTYTVEVDLAVVHHHVEGASVAGLAGSVLERAYRFDADRLELGATVSGARMALTWKRR